MPKYLIEFDQPKDKCDGCPFFHETEGAFSNWCQHPDGGTLDGINGIPDWCPLEECRVIEDAGVTAVDIGTGDVMVIPEPEERHFVIHVNNSEIPGFERWYRGTRGMYITYEGKNIGVLWSVDEAMDDFARGSLELDFLITDELFDVRKLNLDFQDVRYRITMDAGNNQASLNLYRNDQED